MSSLSYASKIEEKAPLLPKINSIKYYTAACEPIKKFGRYKFGPL
jgi:hypothetical protein